MGKTNFIILFSFSLSPLILFSFYLPDKPSSLLASPPIGPIFDRPSPPPTSLDPVGPSSTQNVDRITLNCVIQLFSSLMNRTIRCSNAQFWPQNHLVSVPPAQPCLVAPLAGSICGCGGANNFGQARGPVRVSALQAAPLSYDQAAVHLCRPS